MPVDVDTVRAVEVPTRLVHGPGAVARIGEALQSLGVSRPLLVTDPGVAAAGLVDRVLKHLQEPVVFDQVRPNPDVALVDGGAEVYREGGCDGLVALGGGSSIDTAKSIGVVIEHGGSILSYEWGQDPIERRIPPLVAIPTTAGTGSEVTPWATLWDRSSSTPRKYSLHVEQTWPEAALVDPALTLSAPPTVTRNSALDALSHSLESIWNVNHNPVSDALAVEAARSVVAFLNPLLKTPEDRMLRTEMSRASLMAGLAFSNTRTALAHSISYEMTLRHGLPHGLACSFTLPMVWRMAAGADAGRDQVLARVFGAEIGEPWRVLEGVLRLAGVGTEFAAYGVGTEEARGMIRFALEGARGKNFINPAARLPS
jgi:phosphonate metabolism-associated iron-containing alcohol dehydrogenase